MPKGDQVDLQRTLTFVSFFYFTYSASKACLFPFLTLYFRQLGLSATQTGVICGLKAFVALWGAPLWSSCATKHGRQRIVLMVAMFMMLASNLGLTLLPPADGDLYLAYCNPRNNSANYREPSNNSRVDNEDAVSMPSSTAPTTRYTSTLSGSPFSTSQTSKDFIGSTDSNLWINTKKTTTLYLRIKPTRKLPFDNFHPNLNHDTGSTARPSPHNNANQIWTPKPSNPLPESNTLPESNSQYTEESTADHLQSNNEQSQLEDYQDSAPSYISTTPTLPAVVSPSTTKSNNQQLNHNQYYNHESVMQPQSNNLKLNPNHNDGRPGTHLNWGNIDHNQASGNKKKKFNHKPNQRQRKPTLTENSNSKPNRRQKIETTKSIFAGKPSVSHDRKKRSNVDKHTVPIEASEISQNNQYPQSLGQAQDIVSKPLTSFLESEHIVFVIALLIVVIGESLSCPVDKICDSNLHETLDAVDELDKYKRHRVPSMIGFAIFAVTVAVIVDKTDCRIFLKASHFMIHFYMFAVLLGLAFLLAFFYPIPAIRKGNKQMRFCKGIRLLFADPHNVVVTLTTFIAGAIASNIHNFLFWHMQDLGGSEVVMGVALLVSVTSQIPMLFLTGWLTRKLGHTGVLVVALLCLSSRLLYFAFLWTPWAVVPVEVLCAFSQQALFQTVSSYAEQISPPAMDRSTQSILNSMYHGLGFFIGGSVGGLVYDQVGLKVLYSASAGLALAWGMVVVLVEQLVPKKRKLHYSSLLRREEDADEDYLSEEESDEVYGNDWLVQALKDEL
ncbi:major facilitator superfamily domain-containing protein 6-like protein B [Asterias rubens]|uniref:major facilitator superfamily domain-containing protein 6-like protein B n=1 Tax=Asterias rubens TaxID=7604 RepID=UPI0014554634|nr:major facilitator superfamily domain-containing protein 6-like protein B [Asterias rubens]